ncbi:hypothetical protein N7454_009042 [Penicillium verhagenii]|nr:hypothetical protein N7454_009042 [Penicillium verhagenii]
MFKVFAIVGATGQQGSSVLNHVLNDPELSQQYKLRAITRDVNSEKAQELKKKNVEVVEGDISNSTSLATALTGVHTVFAMTTPSLGPEAFEVELGNAKRIADVAVEQGAEYIIWSTLPSVRDISKRQIHRRQEYIRALPIKSSFLSLGSFMENYQSQPFLFPTKADDGTYVMARHISPQAKFPLLDAVDDAGKFAGLSSLIPPKIADLLSKSSGKTIVYKQVSVDDFKASLPFFQDVFAEGFSLFDEYGYFGPDTEELVAEAAAVARGKLSTFEEYLERHPFQLP